VGIMLQTAEERYTASLDGMLEGFQIIDFDWRYLYLNDTAIRQSHQTKDALLGQTMMQVYPGIDQTEMFAKLRFCMKERVSIRLENLFVFPDFSKGWFELRVEPVPEGISVLSLDISERKEAELRLQENEEVFRMFVEHCPASVAMFDRQMRYLTVSRRFAADFDLGNQNLIGRSHYDVFPELPEEVKEIHRRCLLGAVEKSEGEKFQRGTGKLDWVRWEVRPWYKSGGSIGGILLFAEVITERKQIMEALKESEEQNRSLIEASPDGIVIAGEDGLIEFVSRRVTEFFGLEDEGEFVGHPLMEFLLPEDRAKAHASLNMLLSGGKPNTNEYRIMKRDGTWFWGETRTAILGGQKGKPARLIIIIRDISDHKKIEATLAEEATALRKAKESLIRSNRALRVITACNEALVRAYDESTLLNDICRIIVDCGGYRLAWVGFAKGDSRDSIFPIANAGIDGDAFRQTIWGDDAAGLGPNGMAIHTGGADVKSCACENPRLNFWKQRASNHGFASSIALPLAEGNRVFGALNIYAVEPDAFNMEEIQLLSGLAKDLAFGIVALRLKGEHEKTAAELAASERKFRTLFETAAEGIVIGDAKTKRTRYANPSICRMLGYSTQELLQMGVKDLHPPDSVNLVFADFEAQIKGEKTLSPNIPLQRQDGTILYVDANLTTAVVDGEEVVIEFFTDVTQRITIETERRQSEQKMLETMIKTVELMSKTMELRDPYTAGHQERVTALALSIAKEMQLSELEVEGIRMAATVHDIGKIYVPSEILSKPGQLSNIEFELVKLHAKAGYDILKNVEFPWPIAQMVLQHHERLDGSGYPQGLAGNQIILGARILAVADIVEAMASHRPYRPARGIGIAVDEVSANRGILYDADVVDACLRLVTKRGFDFPS
jgi:PAS domain S-box-containing protein